MMLAAMRTRRDFLLNSAALATGAALAGPVAWGAEHIPLGAQLYTARHQAEEDLPGVLRQIRAIGYAEVETYSGLYKRPAAELRQIIADAGLRAPSGHFGYGELDGRFDYAKALGLEWIVCSVIDRPLWGTVEGFTTAAKQFDLWGRRAKDLGMRFAFHNHDYEFRSLPPRQANSGLSGAPALGSKTGYDVLIAETDPELVFFEPDVYWVAEAGLDPLELLRRLGRRVRLLHLKDRKPGFVTSTDMNAESRHFAEVGSGNLDWKPLLAEAERLGVEHYFVEQDETPGDPIDSLRKSYEYLRGIT
jgi:sugar phosphate isomerase/epimerase